MAPAPGWVSVPFFGLNPMTLSLCEPLTPYPCHFRPKPHDPVALRTLNPIPLSCSAQTVIVILIVIVIVIVIVIEIVIGIEIVIVIVIWIGIGIGIIIASVNEGRKEAGP